MSDKKEFLLTTPALLRTLDTDQRPIWGIMTPQHMVEHFVGAWRISNGRARIKCLFEGEKLEQNRTFLFSDKEYTKNITNPVSGNGLTPLRKPSYESAIAQMEDEMNAFFDFHNSNPNAVEVHPAFGELDYNGWLQFQYKHMRHHLMQFELV